MSSTQIYFHTCPAFGHFASRSLALRASFASRHFKAARVIRFAVIGAARVICFAVIYCHWRRVVVLFLADLRRVLCFTELHKVLHEVSQSSMALRTWGLSRAE